MVMSRQRNGFPAGGKGTIIKAMRLIVPLLLLALSPALASCQQAAIAQTEQDGWESGGEPADPATAGDRLEHRFALADWSQTDLEYAGGADSFKNSRAICARYFDAEPPAADWPLLREVDGLAGCDSFNLAHDIGGPPEYDRARHCALREREEMGRQLAQEGVGNRPVLEGPGLLAVLYANGQGVPRNLPVAIHMACEMSGAAAEMDLRITWMEELRRSGWHGGDFTPCDQMTSGYGFSACTSYAARQESSERDELFAAATFGWSSAERAALLAVRDAFDNYATRANWMNNYGAGMGWDEQARVGGASAANYVFAERLLAVIANQPVPPVPAASEGDITDGGVAARAAVATDAEWQDLLAELAPADRPRYNHHRAETIAARRAFEPKLIAFMRLARPDLTAHKVRVLFRDL